MFTGCKCLRGFWFSGAGILLGWEWGILGFWGVVNGEVWAPALSENGTQQVFIHSLSTCAHNRYYVKKLIPMRV